MIIVTRGRVAVRVVDHAQDADAAVGSAVDTGRGGRGFAGNGEEGTKVFVCLEVGS